MVYKYINKTLLIILQTIILQTIILQTIILQTIILQTIILQKNIKYNKFIFYIFKLERFIPFQHT